ncbi:hypothetical protein DENSPDRAFT_843560 [Dentipellis sp. KUC8613]|nr:hypothetical protein DENSPDRAFT_843560 [Dentipellis sp. KUC8613]
MSPALRYEQNLKVLRRHDPSIFSIFDQFSHVCLYHHNGSKWEKKGYEGSMFLFERRAYPPYGFFILNRMGMTDYVRHMYPEDDMETHGDYLMYRSYPEFTAMRLAQARAAHPKANTGNGSYPSSPDIPPSRSRSKQPSSPEAPDKYTDAHGREPSLTDNMTNWKLLLAKNPDKGESETVGLWMFATDAREPMKEVMMRLHSYIRKVVAYPEEFKYGPDRPPPPNPHLRLKGPESESENERNVQKPSSSSQVPSQSKVSHHPSASVPNTGNGMTELDKLFSKLAPTPAPASATPASTAAPAANGKLTLDALFASASSASVTPMSTAPSSSTVPPSAPNKGMSLLDSIFASATPPPSAGPSQTVHQPYSASPFPAPPSAPPSTRLSYAEAQPYPESSPEQTQAQAYEIHSPKPTSSALPQILTQDVISTLLGLPSQNAPSSRASSAAPSTASSRRSGSQYRYEGDVESSDNDGGSVASVGEYSATSTVYNSDIADGMPTFELPEGNAHPEGNHVLGDVTPRPPLRGFSSGEATPSVARAASPHSSYASSTSARPTHVGPSSSNSTVLGAPHAASSPAPAPAPASAAAPTSASPAPRQLVPFHTDSTLWPYPRAPLDDRDGSDDADVVELDFADTAALSDMSAFDKRRADARDKGKGRKKGRKERLRDNEREKEAIERSWDVPGTPAQDVRPRSAAGVGAGPSASPAPRPSAAASRAAAPSPAPAPAPASAQRKPVAEAVANGKKPAVNGESVMRSAVLDAFVAEKSGKPLPAGKRQFVMEILSLIHTDQAWVDKLWEDFNARVH